VTYRWGELGSSAEAATSDSPAEEQHFQRCVWTWCAPWVEAPRQLAALKSQQFQAGRLIRTELFGCNARFRFTASIEKDAEIPFRLRAVRCDDALRPSLPECFPLSGMLHASLGWRAELLDEAVELPAESCAGVPCEGLVWNCPHCEAIWLDPRHSGLPRRMVVAWAGLETPIWFWNCDQFTSASNGMWFPQRGTFGTKDTTICWFEVETALLNQALPPDAFQIPVPDHHPDVLEDADGNLTATVPARVAPASSASLARRSWGAGGFALAIFLCLPWRQWLRTLTAFRRSHSPIRLPAFEDHPSELSAPLI
jgi:hypothetical protein